MIIHNPILTGSFTVNGTDVASITSSAASITAINSYTASQNILNGTYATTGSNTFKNPQTINSNLVVTGSITAQTLVVQTVSSSVIYSSGSNVFGNNIANTQVMTGSVLITGSVGIGTNNPTRQLFVNDTVFFDNVGSGSTSNPSIAIGSTSLGISYLGGSNMALLTGGSTKMYISASGNIGIGTTSPTAIVQIQGAQAGVSGKNLTISYNGTYYAEYTEKSITAFNNELIFGTGTGGTEKMRILSGGNVGIGTSSPSYTLSFNGDVATTIGMNQGTLGTAVPLTLKGSDGPNGTNNEGGPIYISSGLGTGNANTSNIIFSTAPSGNSGNTRQTLTERMRITSGGIIQLGSSERRNALQQSTFGYGGSYRTLLIGSTGTDYTINAVTLAFNVDLSGNSSGAFGGDGTEYFWRNVGSFKTPNSSNNGYNTLLSWNSSGVVTVTTSDYRAKEDLKSFEALPMIQAMKLYDFRWIELQERMHGVIAHELQEIVPYAVMGEKDGESMQGVDYSKLVPVMLKAIQELQAQITELKNK
jgi:hypothetical protein